MDDKFADMTLSTDIYSISSTENCTKEELLSNIKSLDQIVLDKYPIPRIEDFLHSL